MFEARVLEVCASVRGIIEASRRWASNGLLAADRFGEELGYFRDRYVADGRVTHHFDHLHLRQNDAPALVKNVLVGEKTEPEEIAAAVLIIVYRFRNNLFYGVKWSYELQGQLENFTYANSALMRAIELDENGKPDTGM